MILKITETSYLVKGNTFAVESHTVLLGTLTSASSASSPASAFWSTEEMAEQLEGRTSTLSQFQSTPEGKEKVQIMLSVISFQRLWSHEVKKTPLILLAMLFPVLSKMLLPSVARARCWLTTTLSTRTPRYFLQSSLSMSWFMGSVLPRCRTLLYPLLNFAWFTFDYFFNPLRLSKINVYQQLSLLEYLWTCWGSNSLL